MGSQVARLSFIQLISGFAQSKKLLSCLYFIVVIAASTLYLPAGVAAIVLPVVGMVALRYPRLIWKALTLYLLVIATYVGGRLDSMLFYGPMILFVVAGWRSVFLEKKRIHAGNSLMAFALLCFGILSFLSMFSAVEPLWAFAETLRFAIAMMLFATYINWIDNPYDLFSMMDWFVSLSLVISLILVLEGVLWYLNGGGEVNLMIAEPVTVIKGPHPPTLSNYGAVLAGSVPLFWSRLYGKSFFKYPVRWGCFFLLLTGVYASASRASFLGALFGIGIVTLILSSLALRRVLMMSAFFVLGVGLYFLEYKYGSVGDGIIYNLSGRNMLWVKALDVAKEHPFLGLGAGCWSLWLRSEFVSLDFLMFDLDGNSFVLNPSILEGEAHNLFLTKLAELGYFSFVILVTFFISWFRFAASLLTSVSDMKLRRVVVGAIGACCGLLLLCCFENGPIIGKSRGIEIVIIWFVLSLPFAVSNIQSKIHLKGELTFYGS